MVIAVSLPKLSVLGFEDFQVELWIIMVQDTHFYR